MIVCRSEKPIDISVKEKISLFCHVDTKKVINIHDCPTIYHVPLVMRHQGLVDLLNEQLCLGMTAPKKFMKKWRILAEKLCFSYFVLPISHHQQVRWNLFSKFFFISSYEIIWVFALL